jgi:twitching motility protein PilJ
MGSKLVFAVVGGALVGFGGIVFYVSEVIKTQSEEQILHSLNQKVEVLDKTFNQTKTLAETVRTSVLALHLQKNESAETYRRLLFEQFKQRPEFVVGLGLGQSENGILPKQPWFFSYYQTDSGESNAPGIKLSPPYSDIRYVDGVANGQFYPDSDRYRTYFTTQRDAWSEPTQQGEQRIATYYSQVINDQRDWLGTVFVDIETGFLNNLLTGSVMADAGAFALLTENGQLLSRGDMPETQQSVATYQAIAGLGEVWSQMRAESGIITSATGYWAYQRIPQTNWIAVAFVPQSTVSSPIRNIIIAGAMMTAMAIAVIIFLWLRSLNQQLRPILNKCEQLSPANAEIDAAIQQQDEIRQLSIRFFYLLDHFKHQEEQIRQEVAHIVQAREQLQQSVWAEKEGHALQDELQQLLQVMSAVEEGNLAVDAEVGLQRTGLLADTVNRMTERLGQIIARMSSASTEVGQKTEDLQQLAIEVEKDTQQQMQLSAQLKTLLEQLRECAQQSTQDSFSMGEISQLAQTEIVQSQQNLSVITEGVGLLQQGTEQITKRTHTLNNYVGLAAQFAKEQKRIATMTRILAVNASMLASRAAAQQDPDQFVSITREFETVAAQVNELAIQTNQSLVLLQQRTDQIQTVVSGLDHDVREISQQVNRFTSGFNQSRQTLTQIQSLNDQVVQLGQVLNRSSQTTDTTTQTALQCVDELSAIATTTHDQTAHTLEQLQQLRQVAELLLRHAAFFQLRSHHAQHEAKV